MAQSSTGGRVKAIIFLLVSLFAAAIAALVIFTVIKGFQEQLKEVNTPEAVESIVVANRTLWPGETITDADLDVRSYPPDFIPADNILSTRELAVNRVPVERILASEFIREERLALPDAGRGLPAIVPRGMRAISLNISGGSAVAGFLNPGNFVDVLVTAGTPVQTKTAFQAVTILAVNSRLGSRNAGGETKKKAKPGDPKPVQKKRKRRKERPSITVAVTPEQAEKLSHAQLEGAITLTLRNDIDVRNEEDLPGIDTGSLIGATPGEPGTSKKRRYQRLSIKQLKEQQSNDGSLIFIKGEQKTVQEVKN